MLKYIFSEPYVYTYTYSLLTTCNGTLKVFNNNIFFRMCHLYPLTHTYIFLLLLLYIYIYRDILQFMVHKDILIFPPYNNHHTHTHIYIYIYIYISIGF